MRTLAVQGYSHLVGGGARHRGCALGALYSMHGLPPPPHPRKIGSMRALALWGYSHVGGGGARHRVCHGDTLQCAWSKPPPPPPPPPFIEGRMAACGHLQFGGIPIWLEEGLGIGGVS